MEGILCLESFLQGIMKLCAAFGLSSNKFFDLLQILEGLKWKTILRLNITYDTRKLY